jgi:TRAP transporter 4TM/12TM fusion protein
MKDSEDISRGIVKESADESKGVFEKVLAGKVTNRWLAASALVAIVLGFFQLYTAYAGLLEAWRQRSIHLSFMLLVYFTTQMSRKQSKRSRAVMVLCVILTLAVGAYMFTEYQAIQLRGGDPALSDQIAAGILVFIVLIAAYRSMGLGITAVAGAFLVYCFAGEIFPGDLYHRALSIERATGFLFNATTGIMGVPMSIASTYIILFVIFGAFLAKSGGGQFFIDLALALTKRVTGGPAMSAVVASAFFGTISGSGAANVVGTGTFTIPLMKKVGYPPEVAGAIEAAASTGGMIMPPVMASVAFLIAEFTRTPYATIMRHAIVPALLYFFSVGLAVYFFAKKTGVGAGARFFTGASAWECLKAKGYFLLAVVTLAGLLIQGQSPGKAALYATVLMVVLSYVRKETRMGFASILTALEDGVRNSMSVSLACGAAGIIVGSINATGIGLKISSLILSISGGHLFIVLVLTAIMAIILGMGMNASAVYIIVVSLLVPALIDMKINEMAAHFFAFYYGIISAITPPVALASYAAAGLAGSDTWKTGWIALRLAFVAMIIPFAFAYDPGILLIGPVGSLIISVSRATLAVILLNMGIEAYAVRPMNQVERLAAIAGGAALLVPAGGITLVGLGLGAVAVFSNGVRKQQSHPPVVAASR